MMTVSKAYQLLKQEGYIITDRRSGAVVAPRGKAVVRQESLDALRLNISELRLSGMSREDILNLCSQLYEEGEKK